MQVTTDQLRRALSTLLDHLDETGQSTIELEHDFYWDTPVEGRYDAYSEPRELTVGQLSDDWMHIEGIASGKEEPIGYGLVWAANILRAVGAESTG